MLSLRDPRQILLCGIRSWRHSTRHLQVSFSFTQAEMAWSSVPFSITRRIVSWIGRWRRGRIYLRNVGNHLPGYTGSSSTPVVSKLFRLACRWQPISINCTLAPPLGITFNYFHNFWLVFCLTLLTYVSFPAIIQFFSLTPKCPLGI